MNTENNSYISKIQIEDIPWHRLTTPYGRADEFPALLNNMSNDIRAVRKLSNLVEHQSTLWHSTPFGVIFVCRMLGKDKIDSQIKAEILHLLVLVAEAIQSSSDYGMDKEEHLPVFSDMLLEEYLWSEIYDAEEDEIRFEDEPFSPELFCSFYYFSGIVLKYHKDYFEKLENSSDSIIKDLLIKLNGYIRVFHDW